MLKKNPIKSRKGTNQSHPIDSTPFYHSVNTPSKERTMQADVIQQESPSTPNGIRMKRIDEYFQPKNASNKKREKQKTQQSRGKEPNPSKDMNQLLRLKDERIKELELQVQNYTVQVNQFKVSRKEFELERLGFEKRFECLRREAQEVFIYYFGLI